MQDPAKTILSIQSHVTHGYVGNKAAVFPLQLHGFDCDSINTVSLSNHSGYPVIKGHRMDKEEFSLILEGMRANGFLSGGGGGEGASRSHYRYVLTGYVNNAEILSEIAKLIVEMRGGGGGGGNEMSSDFTFLCDPVMGDEGKLYCKEEVIKAYRDTLLRLANVTTPNYFEASVLSGVTVTDLASAKASADFFHFDLAIPIVIIKSFPPAEGEGEERLQFLVSCCRDCARRETGVDNMVRYTGTVPFYKGRYTGTGDVFAAEFLAFFHEEKTRRLGSASEAGDRRSTNEVFFEAAAAAAAKTMGVIQDLILATNATIEHYKEAGATTQRNSTGDINNRELRVTCSVPSLLNPMTAIEYSRTA